MCPRSFVSSCRRRKLKESSANFVVNKPLKHERKEFAKSKGTASNSTSSNMTNASRTKVQEVQTISPTMAASRGFVCASASASWSHTQMRFNFAKHMARSSADGDSNNTNNPGTQWE